MLDLFLLSTLQIKDFFFFFSLLSEVIYFLGVIISVLIAVAYGTLLERKVMGAMQRRMGPNVVGYLGLLQPLSDGLKLFLKEPIIPRKANKILFVLAPILVFFLSLLVWWFIPLNYWVNLDLEFNLLYLIVINALEIYGILFAGWASNSKYALLGGLRSTAQMVSYELTVSFVYLIFVFVTGSFNLIDIVYWQSSCWFIIPFFPLGVIFFIAMLAETNRTPFDLPEAEAELVAGYNVEYSSMLFALFFLGEYANMFALSAVFVLLFLGGWTFGFFNLFFGFNAFILAVKVVSLFFLFIWVRATLPRYRYDQLMVLGWKILLPFVFSYLLLLIIGFYFFGVLSQFSDIYPHLMWPILNF